MAGARRCFSDAARGPAISGRDKPDRCAAIITTGIPTGRVFQSLSRSGPDACRCGGGSDGTPGRQTFPLPGAIFLLSLFAITEPNSRPERSERVCIAPLFCWIVSTDARFYRALPHFVYRPIRRRDGFHVRTKRLGATGADRVASSAQIRAESPDPSHPSTARIPTYST
jgi:hypothetical protein